MHDFVSRSLEKAEKILEKPTMKAGKIWARSEKNKGIARYISSTTTTITSITFDHPLTCLKNDSFEGNLCAMMSEVEAVLQDKSSETSSSGQTSESGLASTRAG